MDAVARRLLGPQHFVSGESPMFNPIWARLVRRSPHRLLSPVMFVVLVVLAGPALKLAHFLFMWPTLAPLSYERFLQLPRGYGFEFAYVPWVWRAREMSVVAPFPVAIMLVALAWCRDRDRASRESIATSLLRPSQLLHARSTVWLALPLVVLLANMGEHAFERALIQFAAPAESCLRGMSGSGGVFVGNGGKPPSAVPGILSQWNDEIALALVATPGLWMLAIACATRMALRTFRPWESAIVGLAVPAAAVALLTALRAWASPMWAANSFDAISPDDFGYAVMAGSALLMPFSVLCWRAALRTVRRAYGGSDPAPSRLRTAPFLFALLGAFVICALATLSLVQIVGQRR